MHFTFPAYHHPDFTQSIFVQAPQARLIPAPKDGVVPDGYHATTIYPDIITSMDTGCWPRRAGWIVWRSMKREKSRFVRCVG